MKKHLRLFAHVSIISLAAASAPAFAEGTPAGSTVTNNVTVNYKAGTVAQTPKTASTAFVVDRKVNFTIAEVGSATTSVTAGQANAVTTFSVTNTTNGTIDISLAATQLVGTTAPHGGSDSIQLDNVRIILDADKDGILDANENTTITYIDQLGADQNVQVFIVADVPLTATNAAIAAVRLTGTALEGTSSGSAGAAITATTGANTAGVDTVFADDVPSGGDGVRNGITYAEDDFTLANPTLTVAKTSKIISDPLNLTTDPKMIPGAVVEYCIAVKNDGASSATDVVVTDTLPAEVTYDATFGIKVNGTVTGVNCNSDGSAGGSFTNGIVSASIADLVPPATKTVLFRVTVK